MAVPIIPFVPNDIIKCRIFTSCQSQLGVNVLFFKVAGIQLAAEGDLQELAVAVSNRFVGPFLNILSANANYRGVGLQNLKSGAPGVDPSIEVFSGSGADVGAIVSNVMPKQTCGIITKRTTSAKKNGRGRMYLPFPAAADNSPTGQPVSGYLLRAGDIGVACLTEFSVSTAGEGLNTLRPVHRITVSNFPAPGTHYEFLTVVDYTVRQRWGTQRRRGDYGRTNEFPV